MAAPIDTSPANADTSLTSTAEMTTMGQIAVNSNKISNAAFICQIMLQILQCQNLGIHW